MRADLTHSGARNSKAIKTYGSPTTNPPAEWSLQFEADSARASRE
jgi:hypothetical protein